MLARRFRPQRKGSPLWRAPTRAGFALIAIVLCAASPFAASAQAPSPAAGARPAGIARIGYIDMKRLLDSSPQILSGRDALTAEFAQRDQALKAQETRLSEMQAQLKRDAAILPPDVAEAKRTEAETLDRNIKRMRDRMREELNTRRNEEVNKAWASIQDTVIAYARARGYDLVVQSPVIYASATIDITDDVLEQLRRDAAAAPRPVP